MVITKMMRMTDQEEKLFHPPFRLYRQTFDHKIIWRLKIYLGSPRGDVEVIKIETDKDQPAFVAIEKMVDEIKEMSADGEASK